MEDELPTPPDFAPQFVPELTTIPSLVTTPTVPQPEFKDRSSGLMIFGIIQIILGLLAALMIPFAILGAFMSRLVPGTATMRAGQVVFSIVTYAVVAAVLIALGIGSVQTKRWARALTLVFSWYGLVMGVLVTILLTAILPVGMRTAMAQAQHDAAGASSPVPTTAIFAVVVTVIIVFCAFFLVAVPIAFVVFYARKDVAQTCRDRDPVESWTDRTPLPVLGGSAVLFIGSLFLLTAGLATPLFPFFGRYLTGIPASACFLFFAVLDMYLAVALFRLRVVAWWIAVAASLVRMISMALTYAKADLLQAYSQMNLSDRQQQMINSNPLFHSHVMLWWSMLSAILFFVYLLWLKRYFHSPAEPQATVQPAQAG